MYTKGNYTYADAGRLLQTPGCIAYRLPAGTECTEREVPADDLAIEGDLARWAGGICAMRISEGESYASLKTRLIKIRYSNDDQLAVMLNGDADEMERMQAWRAWAADIARRITALTTPAT